MTGHGSGIGLAKSSERPEHYRWVEGEGEGGAGGWGGGD